MKTFGRTLAIGMATGMIALAGAQEVRAASMTTELWGGVDLSIILGGGSSPAPYSVFSAPTPDPDNLTQYPLLPGTNPVVDVNHFRVTSSGGFGGNFAAPSWRIESEITGFLYFTDRTGQGATVQDPTEFTIGSVAVYGAGQTPLGLAGDPSLAVDPASVFWQATTNLFNLNPSGASGLGGGVFSQITTTNPSILWPLLANDVLSFSFTPNPDDMTLDGDGMVTGGEGFFEFMLSGDDGVTSINALWAALGLGNVGDFVDPNDVPTSILYSARVTITAIPVPAALPLMLGALGVLGFAGWKRRRALAA